MTDRHHLNTIIVDRLYQRGAIWTWERQKKLGLLREIGITGVVNFWPRAMDSDLGDAGLDFVWQMSCPASRDMMKSHVRNAAQWVADYLRSDERCALVLCEAGKTRSVFFCVMVTAFHEHIPLVAARDAVLAAVPSASLKGFMLEWIEEQGG